MRALLAQDLYIRSTTSYAFKVTFPPGTVVNTNIIYIDFPSVWNMIINYKLPTCYLYNPDNSTNFANNCTNFGNRITIPLALNDSFANDFYYIVLNRLRNPDMTACDPNKWVISVTDITGQVVVARSHSTHFNVQIMAYIKNPNQVNLKWMDISTNAEITTLDIYKGVYKAKLAIATDYGVFIRSFSIYSNST